MPSCAPDFLIRFPDPSAPAQTVGVGFVVDSQRVLTCAHVVNAALGRCHLSQEQPGEQDIVTLRLPIRDDGLREARVQRWLPPPTHGVVGGDIAGLVVVGEGLPEDLVAARLAEDPPADRSVELFGYPSEVDRPLGGCRACCATGSVATCCRSTRTRARCGGHSPGTAGLPSSPRDR